MPSTPTSHTELNLRVARLSVATAALLGALKLVAGLLTGSLAIWASLVDSVMDLVASGVNYLAVRVSGQPADADHAYGHGKAEALAGLMQAGVVGFSGAFLLVEGVRKILGGGEIARLDLGIAVMVISTLASAWITWKLRSTARKTGSLALAADAVHYASDVWTNLGVLFALVLVRWTNIIWFDGVVAALVALVVLWSAVQVLRRSTDELMDRALPPDELATLETAVREAVPELRGMHDIRTRKVGPTLFMDCHVQLDRDQSFVDAHRLTERVRIAVEAERPGAVVTIHADPDPLLPSDLDDLRGDDLRSPA